jgi:hypothetical protein
MITSAISERREVGGAPYMRITTDRQPSRRELIRPAEFIGDVVNQIAPERRLAAAVLRQATVGLRRFQESKEAAGRNMYWDARRWFISNDAEWPYSFMNVCRSLGLSSEGVRAEVFAAGHFAWVAYSGRVVFATVTQLVGSLSRLFLFRRSGALVLPQL